MKEWKEILEETKSDSLSYTSEKKAKIINDLVYLKQIGGDPVEILIKIIRKFTKTPLAESTKLLNKP